MLCIEGVAKVKLGVLLIAINDKWLTKKNLKELFSRYSQYKFGLIWCVFLICCSIDSAIKQCI